MEFPLSNYQHWLKKKQTTIDEINTAQLPLVLFGCAQFKAIEDFLSSLNVPVNYIIDNDINKQGSSLYQCQIISPEDISNLYSKYNVLILVPFEKEIRQQLKMLENPPEQIYYLDFYFEQDNIIEYISENKQQFEQVFSYLVEPKSQQVYQAVLNYWIERNPNLLSDLSEPRNNQYFPDDIFTLSDHEDFVDAGAFTGDTVQAFLQHTQNKFQSIYAFEPDNDNYHLLLKNTFDSKKIHCFQSGLSDKNEIVKFLSDTSSSKVSENGSEEVSLVTLDSILGDKPVSYLKMDVEGAECAALRGATKVIQNSKPKLAICIYHSIQDLLQVPLLIHQIEPSYQLYIRHYTHGIVETVCYAIPKTSTF